MWCNIAAGVNTSSFTKEVNLVTLKSQVDKLETVTADLIKLNNVLDDDVVKKSVHNELVTKVNLIDASKLVYNTQ